MRPVGIAALVAALVLAAGCGDDEDTATTTSAGSETTSVPETTVDDRGEDQEDGFFTERDEEPGESTADQVEDPETVLELFFTTGDPEVVCGDLSTDRLVSSAYGDEKGCRQAQVPAATPDAIEIQRLEVSGDEATATVIPDGGPNDGIETEVTLVNEDGWLVDSLEADIPAGP